MKRILSLAAAATLLAFTSPKNDDYQKTASGLLYKIVKPGNGQQAKLGEVLKINYVQKINDSVLADSYKTMPVYAQVDSVGAIYQPNEIFRLLHKGDSVVILQFADSILSKMPMAGGSILKKGDKLYLTFKVEDVLPNEAVNADREKEIKAIGDKEVAAIESKLNGKGITNAKKTGKGTFVVIQNPGAGPAIDSGKKVSVRYAGKAFDTEQEFENNIGEGKTPFIFIVGQKQVIEGWDEGLRLLKKGGKATLYIPGFLAYGASPGPGGKPFESLIFDVEIVDVKSTAAPKVAPKKAPVGKATQKPKPTTSTQSKPKTPVKK
jgi:FKBP-type peptidyl-prolyl cis-trans isomerase